MTNPRSSDHRERHWIILTWPEIPAPSAARVRAEGYKQDAPKGAQTDSAPGGEWLGVGPLAEELVS